MRAFACTTLTLLVLLAAAGLHAQPQPPEGEVGAASQSLSPEDAPPNNPFLSQTKYFAQPHRQSYCQSSVFNASCIEPSAFGVSVDAGLDAASLPQTIHRHLGAPVISLAHSTTYQDKPKGVLWTASASRVAKVDVDTFELLAERPRSPEGGGRPGWTAQEVDAAVPLVDAAINSGDLAGTARLLDAAIAGAFQTGEVPLELDAITATLSPYILLSSRDILYVPNPAGICAYGDEQAGVPNSPIAERCAIFQPNDLKGYPVASAMLYSGHICLVTTEGQVLVGLPNLSKFVSLGQLDGRVSNGIATNEDGIVYALTDKKLVAIDTSIAATELGPVAAGDINMGRKGGPAAPVETSFMNMSDRAAEALKWVAEYDSELDGKQDGGVRVGQGSGSTPTIMGRPDDKSKQFIVITDAASPPKLVFFFAHNIPEGHTQLDGAKDARIAAQIPVAFEGQAAFQSEQSVLVAGYGAVVVNNAPRQPLPHGPFVNAFLSAEKSISPRGMARFTLNPDNLEVSLSWVNMDISSPNALPSMCQTTGLIYIIGAYEDAWRLDMVDFQTGERRASIRIGDGPTVFHNSFFSATLPMEDGVYYGTAFGAMKVGPG